ncbi:hypothetical protein T484DRAFT_1810435 [Baffinella frigidus]|nr:hypothetical protein T484DRAFT_1810435 [Cryptophyta sp. CCMP2293]
MSVGDEWMGRDMSVGDEWLGREMSVGDGRPGVANVREGAMRSLVQVVARGVPASIRILSAKLKDPQDSSRNLAVELLGQATGLPHDDLAISLALECIAHTRRAEEFPLWHSEIADVICAGLAALAEITPAEHSSEFPLWPLEIADVLCAGLAALAAPEFPLWHSEIADVLCAGLAALAEITPAEHSGVVRRALSILEITPEKHSSVVRRALSILEASHRRAVDCIAS